MDDTELMEDEFGVPIPGAILPQEQWAKTALKKLPASGPLDCTALFERAAPLVIDIGCGNGRYLIGSSVLRPELNHFGIDALPMVIRYATRRANQRGLHHVRIAVCNGAEFLERYVAPQSVHEIHVYHPQPFQEPRDRHKRLVTPRFLRLVYERLAHSGKLYLQTDNSAYWAYVQSAMPCLFEWHEVKGEWPEGPKIRSRREIIASQKGLPIFRGWGVRTTDHDPQAIEQHAAAIPNSDFYATEKRNPTGWRRKR